MSQELLVTEEMIARQPPEAQAIIRLLLTKIAELEARLNMTPRNSSRPPSTEYQLHRLTCPCCRQSTCAELPLGVPCSQAGPRLVALTALLMGCFKQSKRRVALFLEQVLNQPCSPGWVVKLQNQATAALQPAPSLHAGV